MQIIVKTTHGETITLDVAPPDTPSMITAKMRGREGGREGVERGDREGIPRDQRRLIYRGKLSTCRVSSQEITPGLTDRLQYSGGVHILRCTGPPSSAG
jgi:hypothetical protein